MADLIIGQRLLTQQRLDLFRGEYRVSNIAPYNDAVAREAIGELLGHIEALNMRLNALSPGGVDPWPV